MMTEYDSDYFIEIYGNTIEQAIESHAIDYQFERDLVCELKKLTPLGVLKG